MITMTDYFQDILCVDVTSGVILPSRYANSITPYYKQIYFQEKLEISYFICQIISNHMA